MSLSPLARVNTLVVSPAVSAVPADPLANPAALGAQLDQWLAAPTHVSATAPINPEQFRHVDLTPWRENEPDYQVFNVRGTLMLEMIPAPGSMGGPQWFEFGGAQDPSGSSNPAGRNCWDPRTW